MIMGGDGPGGQRPTTGQNVAQWFYQDWAGEHGPRTLLQLTQALQKGYFTPDLLVRKEGTQRWHTLRDVLDLRQLLRARKHAQPGTSAATPARTAVSLEAATAASAAALAGISPRTTPGVAPSPSSAATSSPMPVVNLIPAVPSSPDDPITNLFKSPGQEWFYVDMHGDVQGPFSSQKMQRWWTNPLYKDHFSSLKCRRGHHGEFRLLPEIAAEVAAKGPPPESPKQFGHKDFVTPGKSRESERYGRTGSRKNERERESDGGRRERERESDLAKELDEIKQQMERMEIENETLRNSQEDTFILRMQVERLLREKAELAREVTMLKREKESLQELLQYAQQFDIADEGVVDELIAGEEEGEEEGVPGGPSDRATEEWFEELRAASRDVQSSIQEGDGEVQDYA